MFCLYSALNHTSVTVPHNAEHEERVLGVNHFPSSLFMKMMMPFMRKRDMTNL